MKMFQKGKNIGNFTAAVLAADAQTYHCNQLGGDAISGVIVDKTAGTGFDVHVQVSVDGSVWNQFALIDETTVNLAISLGLGFPMVRFVIEEGVNDMDIDIQVVVSNFSN